MAKELDGYYRLTHLSGEIAPLKGGKDLVLEIAEQGKNEWHFRILETGVANSKIEFDVEAKKSANQPKCPGCYRVESSKSVINIHSDIEKQTITISYEGKLVSFLMVPAIGFKPSKLSSIYGCYDIIDATQSGTPTELEKLLAKSTKFCVRYDIAKSAIPFAFELSESKEKIITTSYVKSDANCKSADGCYLFQSSAGYDKGLVLKLTFTDLEQSQVGVMKISTKLHESVLKFKSSEAVQ